MSGIRYLAVVAYAGSIVAANAALHAFGALSLWGLLIPAGTLFAGLAFTCRDLVERSLGRWWAVGAILVGAGLSAFLSPQLALASGVAFLVSEGLDMLAYQPLKERHWLGAVALSNTVGLVADSWLFLTLAGFPMAFLPGQLIGKGAMSLLAVAVLWMWRAALARRTRWA
jgi:uncharacterized PurR-regulated membrane protein YhhQ (DUF165 family)